MAGKSNILIVLSQEEKEFIDGALLGDGCITKPNGNSCQFVYTTSKKSHAEYVYQKLKRMAVNECRNGPIKREVFDKRTKKTYISYKFRTINNKLFFDIYHRWYPIGIKIIPVDVIITPISTLIWYVGDGSLMNSRECQYIKLSTHAFDKTQLEQNLLTKILKFNPLLINGDKPTQFWVYIPRKCALNFLNWIGKCPVEEYTYKWNLRPYKYKGVELNGVSDYSKLYPLIINEWKTNMWTIYGLSKKYKVPIRCIKDELTRNNIDWTPIDTQKSIIQCDLFDTPIKTWYSGQEIKRELGYNASSISMCCRGLRKKYKGYKWKFEKTKTLLEQG
jgi:hypothetical protein